MTETPPVPVDFRIDETRDGSRLTLAPTGELDVLTVPELERRMQEAPSDVDELLLDLRGVTFIDSSGLRALLIADETWRQRGGALLVSKAPGQVDQVLEMTQVDAKLTLVDL